MNLFEKQILIVSIICMTLSIAYAGQNTNIEKIRNSIREEYLDSKVTPDSVKTLVSTMNDEGYWSDINYVDTTRTGWQHTVHLNRLILISQACQNAHGIEKQHLLETVERGLSFWFTHDFVCENWWHNKIGTPCQLLAIGYILDDDLDTHFRGCIKNVISVIDVDDYQARPGGDRIQVATNHAKKLIYNRDSEELNRIFRIIENEASFAQMEEIMFDASGGLDVRNHHRPSGRGVQVDFSFHHRGDRVNSTLTYGLELPEYYSYWALLLRNTTFSFDYEHTKFVIDYYLDGICKHLIMGKQKDPGACNRELARMDEQYIPYYISWKLLQICDGYRRYELENYYAAQSGNKYEQPSFAKFFWCSEYFMFQRHKYIVSVRMHSVRNMNMEYPHNGEGIRNHFRGDGACYLSVSGNEYVSTLPVFDFRHIPGVTSLYPKTFPLANEVQKNGKSLFVGAVNDSLYGAVAFDFISPSQSLKAKKSYFFFDEGYVCLGSGISSDGTDNVITTIEQCISEKPALIKSDILLPITDGKLLSSGVKWIWHNDVGYFCIDTDSVIISRGIQQGKWRDCTLSSSYDSQIVQKQLFLLAIKHGSNVHNDHYAYAVVPGIKKTEMDLFSVNPFWRILANTEAIQAVSNIDASLLYIIFYEPGKFYWEEKGHSISVDNPCILMIRNDKMYVSDPTRMLYSIKVEYNGCQTNVSLPTWLYAGTSVPVIFSK